MPRPALKADTSAIRRVRLQLPLSQFRFATLLGVSVEICDSALVVVDKMAESDLMPPNTAATTSLVTGPDNEIRARWQRSLSDDAIRLPARSASSLTPPGR